MDKNQIYNDPVENIGWNSRYICSVLDEMRKSYETRNFSILPGLIEEAQTYANRMEAKLSDIEAYESMKEKYKMMKKECDKKDNEPRTSVPIGDVGI